VKFLPSIDCWLLHHMTAFKCNVRVVFICGRAGSGKGTLCQQLVSTSYQFCDGEEGSGIKQLVLHHLSVGSLLRQHVETRGRHSSLIQEKIDKGELVPKEISVSLIHDAMHSATDQLEPRSSVCFVIDGYPSSLDRLVFFETTICPCDSIIYLECSAETALGRLLQRARSDDTVDCIRKRFETFEQSTLPVIRTCQQNPTKLTVTVNAELSADDIFSQVSSHFIQLFERPSRVRNLPAAGTTTTTEQQQQ